MLSLNASYACPYRSYSGQAIVSLSVSRSVSVFSATLRMIEWTLRARTHTAERKERGGQNPRRGRGQKEGKPTHDLDLLYRSSHLTTSSADTLRFDKSMYPSFECLLGYFCHATQTSARSR